MTLSPAAFNKVYSFIRDGHREAARIIAMDNNSVTVEWSDRTHTTMTMSVAAATAKKG